MTKEEIINKLMKMILKAEKLKKTPEIKKLISGLKNQRTHLLSPHGTERLAHLYWKDAVQKYKNITGY